MSKSNLTFLLFAKKIDCSAATREIDFPRLILPKRRDIRSRLKQDLRLPAAIRVNQSPNFSTALIPIKINALPLGHLAAIDITADDRATANCVIIFHHWKCKVNSRWWAARMGI